MTEITPQIAAVAAVMDEIGQCRNPVPCELCRQRMQSILDIGAESARARITELEQLAAGILASYHQGSDGYRGRVGQLQIGKWQAVLDGHG